jgi:hypothetical protein
MKNIEDKITMVKSDMLTRFPNCHHTIKILLWDDNTDMVECRYGDAEKIYVSRYYNDKLEFYEIDIRGRKNGMLVDEFGEEYFTMQTITKRTL